MNGCHVMMVKTNQRHTSKDRTGIHRWFRNHTSTFCEFLLAKIENISLSKNYQKFVLRKVRTPAYDTQLRFFNWCTKSIFARLIVHLLNMFGQKGPSGREMCVCPGPSTDVAIWTVLGHGRIFVNLGRETGHWRIEFIFL